MELWDDSQQAHHKQQLELQRDLEGIVTKCARILSEDELALLEWAANAKARNHAQDRRNDRV